MSALISPARMSNTARRYNVLVLTFALCAWLVTAALHLHIKDDHSNVSESLPCSYCLVLSAGAAPAPKHHVVDVVVARAIIAATYDDAAHEQPAPSFYLSRGPPRI